MKIVILGGCGYIGSRLFLHLKSAGYDVATVDFEWFGNYVNPGNVFQDYADFYNYKSFDAVILLAGNSSVPMCLNNRESTFENNVRNFVLLLEDLEPAQKFIYASSSSIYGNIGEKEATEDWHEFQPTNYYDLSKKEIDLYARLSNLDYYGLRFGTVNGASPNLRVDIMMNKMYATARQEKKIELCNPHIHRPILGITDLCRGIQAILEGPRAPGIYNMASFNTSVESIVKAVSEKLQVSIVEKSPTPSYNFSINCDKFCKTFQFEFQDTVESIVHELDSSWEKCVPSVRTEKKQYVR